MDVMDFDIDEEDGLSTALGTEALAARDMGPEGFDNAPGTGNSPAACASLEVEKSKPSGDAVDPDFTTDFCGQRP